MKKWVLATAAMALVAGGALAQRERLPANCRQEIRDRCSAEGGGGMRQCLRTVLPKLSDDCRKLIAERAAMRDPQPDGIREIAYGADPKQRMDILTASAAGKQPILFYVHGGGWSIGDKRAGEAKKGPWANAQGWAYVSANYRLVPQATVEQQAADLASAIAWLRANAVKEGLDPDRIVLIGHSAGAHLVALLGTDTTYLQKAGVPLSAVKGVILLDGAGYDIPKQGSAETNLVKPMYDAAFSTDPKRQAALSPTLHAAAPNVADWLILPVERRQDSQAQSKALAAALVAAGARAEVHAIAGEGHASLNKGMGEEGDDATALTEKFLSARR